MINDIKKLSQLAENLRLAQIELDSALNEVSKDPNFKHFTEKLHDNFCKSSHEDMCMWRFEINYESKNGDRWTQTSHKLWLDKALKIYLRYPMIDFDHTLELMLEGKNFK